MPRVQVDFDVSVTGGGEQNQGIKDVRSFQKQIGKTEGKDLLEKESHPTLLVFKFRWRGREQPIQFIT